MLGTEYPDALWYDRKLFETIISQPGERYEKMTSAKKNKEAQFKKEAEKYNKYEKPKK